MGGMMARGHRSGAEFVNEYREMLIQTVSSVMEIADHLQSKKMIPAEMYSNIQTAKTSQEQMRNLYRALDSGGTAVKEEFYEILKKTQPFLVDDLEAAHRTSSERKRNRDQYMERRIRHNLLWALYHLDEDDLKKFKNNLCDRKMEPRLRRHSMEKVRDREDLADLLINTFTTRNAVQVTMEILRMIGCNRIAEKLKRVTERSVFTFFVDENREILIQRVSSVMEIADQLKWKGMITDETYSHIKTGKTSQEQMRILYRALDSGGTAVKEEFFKILQMTEPSLVEELSGHSYIFSSYIPTLTQLDIKDLSLTDAGIFNPKIVEKSHGDKITTSYRFLCPHAGHFQCKVTGLVFVMEGEGEVLYKIEPWDTQQLDGLGQMKPAGPLYNIECFKGPISHLHFPHCEILDDTEENKVKQAVAHFTDDNIEIITPLKVTSTHVIIHIQGLSLLGVLKDLQDLLFRPCPINAQVLFFYKTLAVTQSVNILYIHLLPGNIPTEEVIKKRKPSKYIQTTSKCQLIPGRKYKPSCHPHEYQPTVETFESDLDLKSLNFHPTFEVFLDCDTENVRIGLLDEYGREVWEPRRVFLAADNSTEATSPEVAAAAVKFVDEHRTTLIQRVSCVMEIVDHLESKKMISKETYNEIRGEKTSQEQMRILYDGLHSGGTAVKEEFYEILKRKLPFLVDELEAGPSKSSERKRKIEQYVERRIRHNLLWALYHLDEDDLKKFKNKLCDIFEMEPRLRLHNMEKVRDIRDLADLLINTFTTRNAVQVTMEILRTIGCNRITEELKRVTERSFFSFFVDENRENLMNRVSSVMEIADRLKWKGMITDETYSRIKTAKTFREQIRILYRALDSGVTAVKKEFYEILQKKQPDFKDLFLTVAKIFNPKMVEKSQGDKITTSYRFLCPHAGHFQCKVTNLVFVMEGKGKVLYRIDSWDTQQLGQMTPAGPLYNIECFKGPISHLHLPHCEILDDTEENKVKQAVAHFTDDNIEIITPLQVTSTHVIIHIQGLSPLGIIRDLLFKPCPINAQVLFFYKTLAVRQRWNILYIHLLPGNIPIEEVMKKHQCHKYIQTTSKCQLTPGRKYKPSCHPHEYQPEVETFERDFCLNFHPTFEVFLDCNTEDVTIGLSDEDGQAVWKPRRVFLTADNSTEATSPEVDPAAVKFVDEHRTTLIQRVSCVMEIVDHLLSKEMIGEEMYNEIRREKTSQEQMRILYDGLHSGGAAVKVEFYKILKKKQPYLMNELEAGPSRT
ncbi:uncharacterized protein LOC118814633 [Colossoma macropomum]|uniref:uncharacterized protein LOC118814633 n=1 Tax=Colossoma macropomum TaxID=42526 RepID=UPI001864C0D3|nr:uncharacterized protein LOC118814633 [Colossoma macropomum]